MSFTDSTNSEKERREALPFFLLGHTFITTLLYSGLINLATNPDLEYVIDLGFFATAGGSLLCPIALVVVFGFFCSFYVEPQMNEERAYRVALIVASLIVATTILMVFWLEHVYLSVFILVSAWSLLALSLGIGGWEYFWSSSSYSGGKGETFVGDYIGILDWNV